MCVPNNPILSTQTYPFFPTDWAAKKATTAFCVSLCMCVSCVWWGILEISSRKGTKSLMQAHMDLCHGIRSQKEIRIWQTPLPPLSDYLAITFGWIHSLALKRPPCLLPHYRMQAVLALLHQCWEFGEDWALI